MSRTEIFAAVDSDRVRQILHDSGPLAAKARFAPDGLALLPALHREAGGDLQRWRLLAASPQFCIALMLEGAVALACGEHGSLGADFAWVSAVLVGIMALIRNHIRGFARNPSLTPPTESARELRRILFCVGLAWGLGAFLVLPSSGPFLAFAFACGPALSAVLIFPCEVGAAAFGAPVMLLTAGAVIWSRQPQASPTAAVILIAGVSFAGGSMLQRVNRRRRAQNML